MLKIIKKSEYQRLLDIEESYQKLTGQRWFIISGGRSMTARLMNLSKEFLIRLIMELRQDNRELCKKLRKKEKCRIEKVEEK